MLAKLWKHQEEAIKRALEQDSFALFWECGTGKTGAAINVIRHRCQQNGRLLRVLVLAPLAVLNQWKREFIVFSKIDNRDILVLDFSGKKRLEAFKKATQNEATLTFSKSKVVIVNYESLLMKDFVLALKQWGPEFLVCDESHKCKSHESKRGKIVADLADQIKYKMILTGSPILNNCMDVYQQMRILDGGSSFGKNFWAFRAMYFEDENAGWSSKSNYFPKFIPRASTYGEFSRILSKKSMRVKKIDAIDLPPLLVEEVDIILGEEQRKMYNSMRDTFLAYIEDEEKKGTPRAVMAQLAITKSLRLQQILTGFAKAEDGYIHEIQENPRINILEEYLEQLCQEHKVIVWCSFQENYTAVSRLCEKLKIGFTQYHGLTSHKDREDNLDRFRRDPECRVLISNPKAGGTGINLIEASYSIFFSRTFSLEADIQAESRNHRGGSEIHKKITRINFIARDTIDEVISEVLANKLDAAETILNMRSKI